jgi:hypothetical protein
MKICVLSGRYPASGFASAENHRVYCSYHGYHYIHCNWPTQAENLYLNKFHFIRHYYDLFDFIFWLDDDAFILDMEKPLTNFLPLNDAFISICNSPDNKKIKTVFSSGSFMLACSAEGRLFVDNVIKTSLAEVKAWWNVEHGYFTNGDQDIVVYLYMTNDALRKKFTIFHHNEFNSRLLDYVRGVHVFLLHLTGSPETKRNSLKKIRKLSGLNESLLPYGMYNGFKIIKTSGSLFRLKKIFWKIKNKIRFLKRRKIF